MDMKKYSAYLVGKRPKIICSYRYSINKESWFLKKKKVVLGYHLITIKQINFFFVDLSDGQTK